MLIFSRATWHEYLINKSNRNWLIFFNSLREDLFQQFKSKAGRRILLMSILEGVNNFTCGLPKVNVNSDYSFFYFRLACGATKCRFKSTFQRI